MKKGRQNSKQSKKTAVKSYLNRRNSIFFAEVALDSNRAWCPKPGCNTICHICASSTTLNTPAPRKARAVNCPKCEKEFCSSCSSNWHAGLSCQEHARNVVMQNMSETVDPLLLLDEDGNIKQCPVCKVPIERDAGCAQMMCKKCKHVFCWFCLGSLDVSIEFFFTIKSLFLNLLLPKKHFSFIHQSSVS